ncbi:MAG: serine/threonine protein phosphatase [Saprospiraceae bacterium]|jgi:serine/threonine protein phosphatase 1|nr:serine/threonine protein phosphatase [Saprospiraceae bacterium]
MRRFAISDIHGCLRTFQCLLDQIGLSKADTLYLLGDYIDRGPDSKGVIDLILQLRKEGHQVVCLRGNHEQMLLNALSKHGLEELQLWLNAGGAETIDSFHDELQTDTFLPRPYLAFIRQLDYYALSDDYWLVHAGFNFKKNNPLEDTESMLWIRNWYAQLKPSVLNGAVVVHGHTPTPRHLIEAQVERLDELPVLNIDCGCVYKDRMPGIGFLCAFEMDSRRLFFVENVER